MRFEAVAELRRHLAFRDDKTALTGKSQLLLHLFARFIYLQLRNLQTVFEQRPPSIGPQSCVSCQTSRRWKTDRQCLFSLFLSCFFTENWRSVANPCSLRTTCLCQLDRYISINSVRTLFYIILLFCGDFPCMPGQSTLTRVKFVNNELLQLVISTTRITKKGFRIASLGT